MDNLQGKIQFRSKVPIAFRNADLLTSIRGIALVLQKIQPFINHRGKIIVKQTDHNEHMVVGGLAYITGILPTNFLNFIFIIVPSGFFNDKTCYFQLGKINTDIFGNLVNQRLCVPSRLSNKMLIMRVIRTHILADPLYIPDQA